MIKKLIITYLLIVGIIQLTSIQTVHAQRLTPYAPHKAGNYTTAQIKAAALDTLNIARFPWNTSDGTCVPWLQDIADELWQDAIASGYSIYFSEPFTWRKIRWMFENDYITDDGSWRFSKGQVQILGLNQDQNPETLERDNYLNERKLGINIDGYLAGTGRASQGQTHFGNRTVASMVCLNPKAHRQQGTSSPTQTSNPTYTQSQPASNTPDIYITIIDGDNTATATNTNPGGGGDDTPWRTYNREVQYIPVNQIPNYQPVYVAQRDNTELYAIMAFTIIGATLINGLLCDVYSGPHGQTYTVPNYNVNNYYAYNTMINSNNTIVSTNVNNIWNWNWGTTPTPTPSPPGPVPDPPIGDIPVDAPIGRQMQAWLQAGGQQPTLTYGEVSRPLAKKSPWTAEPLDNSRLNINQSQSFNSNEAILQQFSANQTQDVLGRALQGQSTSATNPFGNLARDAQAASLTNTMNTGVFNNGVTGTTITPTTQPNYSGQAININAGRQSPFFGNTGTVGTGQTINITPPATRPAIFTGHHP